MISRKSLAPRNDNNLPHGWWEVYWKTEALWCKGMYDNNVKVGYWVVDVSPLNPNDNIKNTYYIK